MAAVNVASQANGGTASATATVNGSFPPSNANDGSRDTQSPTTNCWWDAGTVPATLTINFNATYSIVEIDVITTPDNFGAGGNPTLADTCSIYCIKDFLVQYWDGSAWQTLATVTGNNKVWRQFTFGAVSTTKVRVSVSATADGDTRIVELEAWTSAASNFSQSVSATSTGTPTIRKGVGKVTSRTATGTPSIIKQCGKVITRTATTTASISKQIGKITSVTSTGTSSISKQVGKIISRVATGTASFAKGIAKSLSVTSTGTSLIAKATQKIVTVASTGSSSIRRGIGKAISAAGSGTASVSKGIAKALSTASTGTASIVKGIYVRVIVMVTGTSLASAVITVIQRLKSPLRAVLTSSGKTIVTLLTTGKTKVDIE